MEGINETGHKERIKGVGRKIFITEKEGRQGREESGEWIAFGEEEKI